VPDTTALDAFASLRATIEAIRAQPDAQVGARAAHALKALAELSDAVGEDDEAQWLAIWDVQYELAAKVDALIDEASTGRPDAWKAALCCYLAEQLAERTRRYLRLGLPKP